MVQRECFHKPEQFKLTTYRAYSSGQVVISNDIKRRETALHYVNIRQHISQHYSRAIRHDNKLCKMDLVHFSTLLCVRDMCLLKYSPLIKPFIVAGIWPLICW